MNKLVLKGFNWFQKKIKRNKIRCVIMKKNVRNWHFSFAGRTQQSSLLLMSFGNCVRWARKSYEADVHSCRHWDTVDRLCGPSLVQYPNEPMAFPWPRIHARKRLRCMHHRLLFGWYCSNRSLRNLNGE